MKESSPTKKELLEQITALKKKIRKLGKPESRRKQSESALSEIQSLLSSIVESTNDLIWSVDPISFGLLSFNQNLSDYILQHTGVSIKIGMRPEDMFSTDDYITKWHTYYKRVLAEGPYKTENITPVGTKALLLSFNLLKKNNTVFGISVFGKDITERKRTEEALRESEEKYRNIFEKSVEGIYQVSPEGRLINANSAAARILGYESPEELISSFTDIGHQMYAYPEDRIKAVELLRKYGFIENYEVQCRHKNGSIVWVIFNARLVRDDQGNILLHEGTIQDITKHKQDEETLQESEEKFSKIFFLSPLAVTIAELNTGLIINANDSFENFFGYPRHEIIGKSTIDLGIWVNPEERQAIVDILRYKNKAVNMPAKLKRKSGEIFNAEFFCSIIIMGDKSYLLSTAIDITERKQAEVVLRESELRYKQLFDAIPESVLLIGTDGCVVAANRASALLYGYESPQQIEGFDTRLLITESDRGRAAQIQTDILQGAERPARQYIEVRRDGSEFVAEVMSTTLYGPGQEVTGYIGITRDITERKQAEDDKVKLEKQLLQSQKMEAIGTLAGGIAHDFNNILAIINGFTEMAMDEDSKETRQQNLQEILKSAERAKNLVKQILTFSRQDGNEKKPLDIKVLLKEAIKFLRASIPTTVEIKQQITGETCNIMADPTQMHQVIMNLCTNASHAMKETGGTLKIELSNIELANDEIPNHPDLQTGPYVKLTVSDTGHGIDPSLIQRIFDPFFTTKSVDEGTGLGLSVVFGIVNSHGGVINVFSEPEQGATFNIYLPKIIQTEKKEVDAGKPVIGGTEQILFVDDEPALVDLGRRMLSSLGYYVTGVLSSLEALDLFHAQPESFDLVITDMTLPKMTGIELSRKLLQIRPNIPIILCSGIKDPDAEAQVKSIGIKAYIMKPLTKRELAGVMREVLDGRE